MKYEDCLFSVEDVPAVILERHGVTTYLTTILMFEHFLKHGDDGFYVGYGEDDFPPGLLDELEEKGIVEVVDQTDVDNGVWIRVKKEIHIEHMKLAAEVQDLEIIDMSNYVEYLDEVYRKHDL